MQRDLLKFLKKIIIFIPLITMLIGFPFLLLFLSKEIIPIDDIISIHQRKSPIVLFGTAYIDLNGFYKLQATKVIQPHILVLGNSRIMPMRENFFTSDKNFYNAGGCVIKITDFYRFLEKIPINEQPELLILGLDQVFFSKDYQTTFANIQFTPHRDLSQMPYMLYSVLRDYFHKKFTIHQLFIKKPYMAIGMDAIINEDGYLNDGSRFWGKDIHHPDKNHIQQNILATQNDIRLGLRRFLYANKPSPQAIEELNHFLKYCAKRKIKVIGILPPFSKSTVDIISNLPNKQDYMLRIYEQIKPIFDQQGAEIYDYTDISQLGANEMETIDGYHASEKAFLRIHLDMLSKSHILKAYTANAYFLEYKLRKTKNHFTVFPFYKKTIKT